MNESLKKFDFEFHKEKYKTNYGEKNEERVLKNAIESFHPVIFEGTRELMQRGIQLSNKLQNAEAIESSKYGVGRRGMMLFESFKSIFDIIYKDRQKPLNFEESTILTSHINLLYINISGIIDNYAQVLFYEMAPKGFNELSPNQRGLFNKSSQKLHVDNDFWLEIGFYKEWFNELSKKRHPATHRIPLCVIPNVIHKGKEEKLYQDTYDKHVSALNNADLDKAQENLDKLDKIGRFMPYFYHSPKEGFFPIEPTILIDLSNVVRIFFLVENNLFDNVKI